MALQSSVSRVARVDAQVLAGQRDVATADIARKFLLAIDKEIHMTTNKPVELGKVSEQTKQWGPSPPDHPNSLFGEQTA